MKEAACSWRAITGLILVECFNASINGGQAVSGVAYLDVPRAVRVVSSGAGDTSQTITVYGTDYYGQAMREIDSPSCR